MKKDQLITKETESLSPSTLRYTVSGLTASTAYTVEIVALTAKGPGPVLVKDIVTGVPPGTYCILLAFLLSEIAAHFMLLLL